MTAGGRRPQPEVSRLRLGTELERIAEQLKSLARAQDELHDLYEAVLSRRVPLTAVLELIVATAMDLVGARYGALGVLDEDGRNLALFVPMGLSQQQKDRLAGVNLPRGRGLLGHLITHPEPLRVDAIGAHPGAAGFPPGHPPMHTLLGAPITIRGAVYGDLFVADRHDGRPFEDHDESLIVALAGAAALAIDDARLYEQARLDSERFQRLLLPRLPGNVAPFQAAATYRPAATPGYVGGDWYDALLVPDRACAAVIGDIAGHDLQAAAAMAQTRNMLRGLLHDERAAPSAVLTRLDRALHTVADAPVTTACLGRVEPDPGAGAGRAAGWRLRWSTAGHPAPLLIRPGGETRYLHAEPDLPLGVDPALPRHDHTCPLPAGATVVLFTDGLVEHRRRPYEEGLERLARVAAANAARSLDALVRALADRHPSDGHDDMAVLAVRTPE